MKNSGKAANPIAESETTANENTIQIDPCSSPPCKRLKQAVLPFKLMSSSQATASVSLEAVLPFTDSTCTNINQHKVSLTKESCRNTGLVTGAPSPPDVELCSEQWQISRASSDVEREAKGLVFRSSTSRISPTSLQMNSPPLETEAMAVDLSAPANVFKCLEPDCTPGVTSAEKPKKTKEEREKEKLDRQKLREVKLKEKQEIKAAKEKERLEAKRKREEERQEKLAERERKEKEKLEKREKDEKERLEKKEKRDEERKKKEEERNAKTEEKRKRDEEKRSLEEEQARKRQKVQESFANYFTKTTNSIPKTLAKTCSRFRPFEIKPGMSLAPVTRKQSSSENKILLDQELFLQECGTLYLKELEGRKPIPKYTKQKLPSIAEDEVEQDLKSEAKENEGVVVIDENSSSSIEVLENKATTVGLKRKLLQFHTNYRPAYFGTWRKYSQHISPRNPFKKDMNLLDYDVDSDDEWEEEEPGESLSNSEGEEEDGEEDADEDDDGFFVPHGYLSDDEGVEEEDVENGDKGNETSCKQAQQLAKAKAWETEMKKKCKPQKPLIVGCLWHEDATMNTTLKQFAAVLLVDEPIEMDNIGNKGHDTPGSELFGVTNGAHCVPNEAMPDLIKLVHGNTAGLNKLVLHFRKQWMAKCLGRKVTDEEVDEKSPISKRQVEKRIQLIATKERRTDRLRWYVHDNILEKFSVENLQLADACNTTDVSTECSKIPGLITPSNTPSIMHFAKTVSPLNRGSSHELKSITFANKWGNTENEASSLSPMEVMIHAPFHINVGPKTVQSETPVTSNVAFNSFLNGNNVVAPICKKLDLTAGVDGKTGSSVGEAMSLTKWC